MSKIYNSVKPHPEVVCTELENKEAVLLHLGTKMYFSLNETGAFIWRMISKSCTVNEICRRIHDEYAITVEKAGESVENLMNDLAAEKLIEVLSE